jgi:AraC family transcriptional regulator, regulatory protein of adaptative response / methylated-DNA-[protein]-cysteine methyltransferase
MVFKENRKMQSMAEDYLRIEKAIHYLDRRFPRQPDLNEVAKSVNLSPWHFQRLFRRWAGISPKRFLQFLMLDYAKHALEQSGNVLDAAYAAGLSSPSRLHDLFVSVEAVTPGEFKKRGAGLRITYGYHASPFGECLLATTERGICAMYFVTSGRETVLNDVRRRWPGADFVEDPKTTGQYLGRIFPRSKRQGKLPIDLRGTNFQIKVWQALLEIPPGAVIPYEELAGRVGNPKASRAVGSAVGQNPIAFIIPCHRVIRKVGAIGGYHGGTDRKRAMLAWEAARTHNEE